jgi:AraC-like DNA-binding protein
MLLTGPWLEPLAIPVVVGSRYRGIRFRPGAVAALLGVAAGRLLNTTQPAEPLLGDFAARLRAVDVGAGTLDHAAHLLDQCLLPERQRWAAPDPLVREAAQQLVDSDGAVGIAALAESFGVSDRTLRRRFSTATGLAPKQFARIRRLLAAGQHAMTGEQRWGEIAAAAGYADQPHLHHDFVELTGLRPNAFGSRLRMTEHEQASPDRFAQDATRKTRDP